MIKLLKMEFRRIFHARWLYIVLLSFSVFYLFSYMTSPVVELDLSRNEYLANQLFSGNVLVILMMVISSVTICKDYTTGVIKTLFISQPNKKIYFFSKIIVLMVIAAIYLIAFTLFNVIGFTYIGNYQFLPDSSNSFLEGTLMLLIGFCGITGLITQNFLFCIITRNVIVSCFLSIVCGMGVIANLFKGLICTIDFNYEPFMLTYSIHDAFNATMHPVQTIVIAIVWSCIYSFLTVYILNKKDIC